jgi:hypothetical protein
MTDCSEAAHKLFRFTLLSKNASANHLESHSYKNKGLKVPCFHTLTKKGVGEGVPWGFSVRLPTSDVRPLLFANCFNINTYKKCVCKSFNINTYKNKGLKVLYHQHLQKRVGGTPNFVFRFSSFACFLRLLCLLSLTTATDDCTSTSVD